ncbi:hypothetical protein DFJ63DRAFT_311743 [Scheffersomyces coipomensis]|uniref:uncharacterized protein n=1 Tax=Scheffersomyces coipomensis TaxID=1788519 RepID=UPI00315C7F22
MIYQAYSFDSIQSNHTPISNPRNSSSYPTIATLSDQSNSGQHNQSQSSYQSHFHPQVPSQPQNQNQSPSIQNQRPPLPTTLPPCYRPQYVPRYYPYPPPQNMPPRYKL